MRKHLVLALIVGGVVSAFAKTNYVDCALGDYAGHDGTSWEKAFKTIQEGVNACGQNDTVLVAPGRYVEGGKRTDADGMNRVHISTSGVLVKAVEGPSKTFIVGEKDTVSPVDALGNGPNAVRCVYSSGPNSVVEGFTLTDGAAHPKEDKENVVDADGGAFRSSHNLAAIVDCVVTNCSGVRGGALRNATAVRCLFVDNASSHKGAAANASRLLNCVVARSRYVAAGAIVAGTAVNCTITMNDSTSAATETVRFYNCVTVCNGTVGDAGVNALHIATNSLFTAGANSKGMPFFSSVGNTITNASPFQLANPALGDFRLLPSSVGVGLGDAEHLTRITVPAKVDPYLDIEGKAIAKTGAVNVGALQTLAPEPQGGILHFTTESVSISGMRSPKTIFTDGLYVVGTEPYQQIEIKAVPTVDTKYFFAYKRSGKGYNGDEYRFAKPDDSTWMMVPPKGLVFTNQLVTSTKCYYVKPDGDDSKDGLTPTKAFKTIQKAVNAAGTTRTVIRCAAGVYDSDDNTIEMQGVRNRVSIGTSATVRIIGAGAGQSFILGEPDDDDPAGDGSKRGPKAVRCLANESSVQSLVQGFTIANGRSNYVGDGTGSVPGNHGGGVFDSTGFSGRLAVTDCVISNCAAYRGAAFGGWYYRCRFTKCMGLNGGIRYAKVNTSVLDYNDPGSGTKIMLSYNVVANNCTVIGGPSSDVVTVGIPMTNSVVYRTSSTTATWSEFGGTYFWNPNVVLTAGIVKDPQLAAPGTADDPTNDYRLLTTSPCVGGGLMYEGFVRDYSPDYNGNPLCIVNGKPTAGAIHTFKQGLAVLGGNGVAFTHSGTNSLAPGESVVVTYNETSATRPVSGVRVNGVEEPVENGKSWTFTAPAADQLATEPFTIEAVFSTNWYVNANAPDNSGNGFRPETAKKSFHDENGHGILDVASVQAGDCVHAAAGRYDTGTKDISMMKNRLALTKNVTVVADEGPENTFIVGESATENPDAKGRGIDGVRCVALQGDPTIIGFTITGGRVNYDDKGKSGYGGGIHSSSGTKGRVIDCVISNNAATRGGGMHAGVAIRCKFFDNWASANRAAKSEGEAYSCVFDHNRGVNAVQNTTAAVNCTFGSDNLQEDGTTVTAALAMPFGPIVNCVIAGTVQGDVSKTGCAGYTNCVFLTGRMQSMAQTAWLSIANCVTTTVDKVALDANYSPIIGESILVDAGDPDLVTDDILGFPDVNGGQRVYNGTIDIGAVEADWRGVYAVALDANVTVTNATPGVKLVDGRVRLSDGDSLNGVWTSATPGKKASYAAALTASRGTLAGVLGEETVSLTDGNETRSFKSAATMHELDFAFTGEGYGELRDFAQWKNGLTLTIR